MPKRTSSRPKTTHQPVTIKDHLPHSGPAPTSICGYIGECESATRRCEGTAVLRRNGTIPFGIALTLAIGARFAIAQGYEGVEEFEPVDAGVGDINSIQMSLRDLQTDLQQPFDFQQVYHVPGRDDLLMRVHGGLFAVFPQSYYTNSEWGPMPQIPPGTIFQIGLTNLHSLAIPGNGFAPLPEDPTGLRVDRRANIDPVDLSVSERDQHRDWQTDQLPEAANGPLQQWAADLDGLDRAGKYGGATVGDPGNTRNSRRITGHDEPARPDSPADARIAEPPPAADGEGTGDPGGFGDLAGTGGWARPEAMLRPPVSHPRIQWEAEGPMIVLNGVYRTNRMHDLMRRAAESRSR